MRDLCRSLQNFLPIQLGREDIEPEGLQPQLLGSVAYDLITPEIRILL